ncbi:MAG: GMC family oxidoreductase [Kofleriaceae bacterium]|nr:GMC family oxidoreductase [Kofleriaceae bacterium]MCL4224568.1 GMC family oxidoreductase [Myxococcales bacterium]
MADVIIIGSGFGGSIAAKRFTEAGHHVQLLELGEDWRSPAKLQQSQDTKFILRLFRDYPVDYLQAKPKVVVTQGMGLGGGSLVYSGIHLRAPASAFTGWPGGFTRARLDHYYARVEQRLAIAPLPGAASYRRSQVFAEAASLRGLPAPVANPLAMTGCTGCGWCVPICKWGKKNTMAHTYLADALATGRLTIRTNVKAQRVARSAGKYHVYYWGTGHKVDNYHTVNSGTLYGPLVADWVVIAGGAIESPTLLKRSAAGLAGFDTSNVGNGVDGTGDFVQGGLVNRDVQAYKGAIMMNHIDRGDYVLEDIHAIPVGPTVKLEAAFADLQIHGKDRTWGLAYKQRFRDFGKRLFGIGIMGKQGSGTVGNITVTDEAGNARLSNTAYQPPPGSLEDARAMITALGGTPVRTLWERSGVAATVHPVGGCRMGDVSSFAVQATNLEVRGNPGLYVIDGSVLPGSPFRNPSHTIAAVAERAMDVILGVHAPTTWPT